MANGKAKAGKKARSENLWGYIMVAPTIIGLLVLNIYPFLDTIKLSFSKTRPFGLYELRGIENYVEMFTSAEFWRANLNTIWFCVLTVPLGIFLALIVAVMLNTKIKGRTAFRAIFFLPMVVVSGGGGHGLEVDVQYGIRDHQHPVGPFGQLDHGSQYCDDHLRHRGHLVLHRIRRGPASFGTSEYFQVLLRGGQPWDGASKIQQFFYITLPMVSPTLFVVLIMRLMSSIKVYDLIYMMIEESNPAITSAQSLMYLFYRESFISGNRGLGSSVVIWTVALIGLVTAVQFWGQKKWVNYEV